MEVKIYVLHKKNGYVYVYVGGTSRSNLTSYFVYAYHAHHLVYNLKHITDKCIKRGEEYRVIFTDDETLFEEGGSF